MEEFDVIVVGAGPDAAPTAGCESRSSSGSWSVVNVPIGPAYRARP